MFTITISTDAGETITSSDPAALVQQVRIWIAPTNIETRHALRELRQCLDDYLIYLAGTWVNYLGLNFAWTPKPPATPTYLVPVDPADATICEACS